MRMLCAIALCALLACGGRQSPPPDDDDLPDPGSSPDAEAEPPRTELQRRQDAACERVIPRLTECAVADARKNLTPAQLAELDLENTAPIHTREHLKKCKENYMSSRQVRVYEVCDREETECEPLAACLENAKAKEE